MVVNARAEPLALAESVLALLDRALVNSTYKYAVLLGLLDACMEHAGRGGRAPEQITTHELAEKVLALYWPQAVPAPLGENAEVLSQNAGPQAVIITEISRVRSRFPGHDSIHRVSQQDPVGFEDLVDRVELTLIEMPLPRLQVLGIREERFLYDISWTRDDTERRHPRRRGELLRQVRERQLLRRNLVGGRVAEGAVVRGVRIAEGTGSHVVTFDERIRLRPGIGDAFLQLAGLLRPLIQRQWSAFVARRNQLEEAELEAFLFGVDRVALTPVRRELLAMQGERCFYCRGEIEKGAVVDHFMPWSRHPENAIENLVVADAGCNGNKSDHLASAEFVARWSGRDRSALRAIAERRGWETSEARVISVARAVYLRLPDEALLWSGVNRFEATRREELLAALAD